jgi:predicted Zn finger-like uncharacterized protein
MSMVTKCPDCGTTFRVTPQQLQAQQGMVRCGRCSAVFDGFKALATLPDELPSNTGPQLAASGNFEPTAAEVVMQPQTETGLGPAPALEIALPEPQPEFGAEPFAAGTLPNWRAGGWAFAIVLLLIVLAAQAAYFYRSDIAANVPEARPYLARICEFLRCTVALPQQPRMISIEGSDMQELDPANPGLIALNATLRNNATTGLGYPSLDVILTDSREHTVARRVFLPAEYLDPGADARAGIPPNAEIPIRLDIDASSLGATGFRLALLPAPMR